MVAGKIGLQLGKMGGGGVHKKGVGIAKILTKWGVPNKMELVVKKIKKPENDPPTIRQKRVTGSYNVHWIQRCFQDYWSFLLGIDPHSWSNSRSIMARLKEAANEKSVEKTESDIAFYIIYVRKLA